MALFAEELALAKFRYELGPCRSPYIGDFAFFSRGVYVVKFEVRSATTFDAFAAKKFPRKLTSFVSPVRHVDAK
jgi:hypothetical protein